ncbi:MAG TPA: DUF3185 domain-containing protein [Gammaproteobacteria bacterium]|jgi:hypothetical protein|nr:DUF3185 domain-containing protein [Gammaproteobacteria bacterium]
MKTVINILGVLLVVIGICVLGYQGFTYTQHEKIAQIGNIQVTADTENTVHLSPILGGLALISGVILVVFAGRR